MFSRRELLKAALATGMCAAVPRTIQSWADADPDEPVNLTPLTEEYIERLFPPNEYGAWEKEWVELHAVEDGKVVTKATVLTSLLYRVTVPVEPFGP